MPRLGAAARSNRRTLTFVAVIAVCLVGTTLVSHRYGALAWPEVKAFVPICATLWSFADILTAFFLLSQFVVTRKLAFVIIACGYATPAMLTVPYLYFFPGAFLSAPLTLGELQISVYAWVAWHLVFPVAIAIALIIDGSLDRVEVPRGAIAVAVVAAVTSVLSLSVLFETIVFFGNAHLPVFIEANGHFRPLFRSEVVPFVVLVNALACAIVILRARMAPLQLCFGVALLAMTLDTVTNAWAPGRYSMIWYVGKLETVVTSSVVLGLLLLEIASLYRRLYDVASFDTLTGLLNRRSFNDRVKRVLDANERSNGVAFMVLDVDHFKAYNDAYGHAEGDVALAAVAGELGAPSFLRSSDAVGRFGGEEFVIFVPDVLLDEAKSIAERVRGRVARVTLLQRGVPTPSLTVSVGVAFASPGRRVTASELFLIADAALYAAKSSGRNRVVVHHVGEPKPERRGHLAAV